VKLQTLYLALLLLSPTLHAATVTIQGAQTNQVIDGFGVNANHRSWDTNNLPSVLDALIDQAGMTLFRVIYDNTDWEGTNDNADSTVFNWTNYNAIYSSAEFTKLWDMMAYLNQRGITNGAIMNFMGYGPAWLCGSANFSNQVLTAGLEDEWAEMIASAIIYARNTRGLQFRSVMPNNEPDIVREGIHVSGASQYITAMRKLAQKLDTNGLGDVKLIGPDLSGLATGYVPSMLADSLVMSKVEHVSVHNYVDSNSDTANTRTLVQNSAYPDRTVWVTEYNVWCSTCDSGTRGTYDWTYCEGTAKYLLNNLLGGASAGMVYEGYDSYYAHHGAWGFWGLFAVDNENALVKTYTPRKHFYTLSQISKWVRPGAQRIDVTGTASPFSPLVAFKHTGLGQITIVGINTSGSAATLNGALASLPTVPYLNLYYTTATTNLANGGSVPVTNGTNFSATIPADCVFTLTYSPLVVTTTNLPSAEIGGAYSFPLAASGGVAPYVWGVASNASAPLGLTLSTNGVVSGVPSSAGQYNFPVVVTDSTMAQVSQNVNLGIVELILTLGVPPQTAAEIGSLGFRLTISANLPGTYLIQQTPDLNAWVDVQAVNYSNGVVEVTNPRVTSATALFYRAFH